MSAHEEAEFMERILKKLDEVSTEIGSVKRVLVGDLDTGKPGVLEDLRTIKRGQEVEAEQTQIFRKDVLARLNHVEKRTQVVEQDINKARAKVAGIATGFSMAGVGIGTLIDRFFNK